MPADTRIGGAHSRFPETRRSAVIELRSPDEGARKAAWEAIVTAYWKPVYKTIRLRWSESSEDAKDLTQAFFARAIEKDFFRSYDPGRGSFRTFLRTCLDGFVANERKSAQRLKRGGGALQVALDFGAAEDELRQHRPARDLSPEDYFHREWVRGLFTLAIERLKRECEDSGRQAQFQIFERYDLDPGEPKRTYRELAAECGIAATDVTNYLAAMRRRLRHIVLERLREITLTDREFRREARAVLGVEV
jgi:RNA polymerase sigma factor (sigma-70 family)